jgi:serine/threonine protein kinase
VTISCSDANGLLEYITKLLSSGGSRVLDADVMLSTDGIVLDRFVVEMNGRLRLDKLKNCIEAFVASAEEARQQKERTGSDGDSSAEAAAQGTSPPKSPTSPVIEASGPIYVFPPIQRPESSPRELREEIESAVPLTHVLESANSFGAFGAAALARRGSSPVLHRQHSMPSRLVQPILSSPGRPRCRKSSGSGQQSPAQIPALSRKDRITGSATSGGATHLRQRRPLVNREATNFGDVDIDDAIGADYIVPLRGVGSPPSTLEDRAIPLIPFEELMLIETLGMGRVSTIYRAAWQRDALLPASNGPHSVEMVALKVATVDPDTGDTSHMEELRREADIAAMLQHPSVCELIGVAADAECFCLAYEFCEGGSLLALLSDNTRYYEYLPIALDIANAMAYLHSRDVIHRDLKPSNVLLTRDHRAKIADFGMSVANTGQELTAETGTYRYMAPEVIRHESYSSNADVYSFGIVLWQLITREVPFATMTPIQAAFAVAGGRRPEIPPSTPGRLQEIITACWDQDSQKRPSFTYIAMALADYARMAFSPANVGAQTLQIANEMLANVEGNSTVNVDFSTPVLGRSNSLGDIRRSWILNHQISGSYSSNVGLEI